MRFNYTLIVLSISIFVFISINSYSQNPESLAQTCQIRFEKEGKCPKEICLDSCQEPSKDSLDKECKPVCLPKSCFEIDAKNCPHFECQVLEGCSKEKVCYVRFQFEPMECGTLAYAGELDCCEGFVKRCGVEYFDGSCDKIGKNSVYSVPICLPCGNGICNQFESNCNCPEDCEARPK